MDPGIRTWIARAIQGWITRGGSPCRVAAPVHLGSARTYWIGGVGKIPIYAMDIGLIDFRLDHQIQNHHLQ